MSRAVFPSAPKLHRRSSGRRTTPISPSSEMGLPAGVDVSSAFIASTDASSALNAHMSTDVECESELTVLLPYTVFASASRVLSRGGERRDGSTSPPPVPAIPAQHQHHQTPLVRIVILSSSILPLTDPYFSSTARYKRRRGTHLPRA